MGFSAVLRILAGFYLIPRTLTLLFTATKCAYVNTMDFDTFLFTATKCANSFIPVFLPVRTWYETCAHC